MKFRFIKEHRSSFPVKKMCQVLGISQSGYYRWQKAPESSQHRENKRLTRRIQELFKQHKGMVGSPIITADIREDPDFSSVSRRQVARLMREMGLKCQTARKFVVTTDSKHNEPISPNLLDRNFTVAFLFFLFFLYFSH